MFICFPQKRFGYCKKVPTRAPACSIYNPSVVPNEQITNNRMPYPITDEHPAITDKYEECTHKTRSVTTWCLYSHQQPIRDHKLILYMCTIQVQNKKKSLPHKVQHLTESARVVTANSHKCQSHNSFRRRYNLS
jgi:hypothetical protein